MADVKDAVKAVAERVTGGRGFELVDVEIKNNPGGRIVRLFVDKEGGIGLDDTSRGSTRWEGRGSFRHSSQSIGAAR